MPEQNTVFIEDERKKFSIEEMLHGARINFIASVLKIFLFTIGFVILLIIGISIEEYFFIQWKIMAHADRSINPTVIATLIGATTVQVGAALIAITNFLFKGPK